MMKDVFCRSRSVKFLQRRTFSFSKLRNDRLKKTCDNFEQVREKRRNNNGMKRESEGEIQVLSNHVLLCLYIYICIYIYIYIYYVPIFLQEGKSLLRLSGLGLPHQSGYYNLLQQLSELLTPHFNNAVNKHGVERHIVTHGPSTHTQARRLDQETLSVPHPSSCIWQKWLEISLNFTTSYCS